MKASGFLSSVLRKPEMSVQAAILLALLVLTPYAMSFSPYSRIYTDGVHRAPHAEDPLYVQRAGLIAFGLLGALVCLGCTISAVLFRPPKRLHLILLCSMTLCALAVGWRSYPYWVNGVHRAPSSFIVMSGLDPKALIPMAWIGEIWRIIVLLLYPVTALGTVILLLATYRSVVKEGKPRLWVAVPLVLLSITVVTFLALPNYLTWLMD